MRCNLHNPLPTFSEGREHFYSDGNLFFSFLLFVFLLLSFLVISECASLTLTIETPRASLSIYPVDTPNTVLFLYLDYFDRTIFLMRIYKYRLRQKPFQFQLLKLTLNEGQVHPTTSLRLPSNLILLTLSPVVGSKDENWIGIIQKTKHRYLVTSSARSSWSTQPRGVTTALAHIPFFVFISKHSSTI